MRAAAQLPAAGGARCAPAAPSGRGRPQQLLLHSAGGSRRTCVAVAASAIQGSVRPYTLRKGDTLESISRKRGVTEQELMSINPDAVGQQKLQEGQTILLPAEKLSARDKEILGGIGSSYRVYPVRKGESVNDIITKRGISMEELQSLNPGVDLQGKAGTLLKLPANKFTVREREMLIGSGVLPREFFEAARNPFVLGFGGLLGVCGFVLAWMINHKDEDFEDLPKPLRDKS